MPLHEIETLLNAGKIGLLTEVAYGSGWVTLREFLKEVEQTADPVIESATNDICPLPVEPLSDQSNKMLSHGLAQSNRKRAVCIFLALGLACFVFAGIVAFKYEANRSKSSLRALKPIFGGNASGQSAPLPNHPNLTPNLPITTTNIPGVQTNLVQFTNLQPTNISFVGPNLGALGSNQAFPIQALVGSDMTAVSSSQFIGTPTTNVLLVDTRPLAQPPKEPPLPENEIRTFSLSNHKFIRGRIIHVSDDGLVFSDSAGNFTLRMPWDNFDAAALEREPKVISFKAAKEAKRQAQESARIEAERAAAEAKAKEEERIAQLAAQRARQDALIANSIATYGSKVVKRGYLQAWGTQVSIGEIFDVVAPSASWSANKLSDFEPERYTHYLVEARWTNKNGERVAMQYLVTADGSDFHLHGCFVSGVKMPDMPFLVAVKKIWDESK